MWPKGLEAAVRRASEASKVRDSSYQHFVTAHKRKRGDSIAMLTAQAVNNSHLLSCDRSRTEAVSNGLTEPALKPWFLPYCQPLTNVFNNLFHTSNGQVSSPHAQRKAFTPHACVFPFLTFILPL